MPTVFFVTHPEVAVDPEVPVPQWGLSSRGRERMAEFARSPDVARLAAIWSSAETKAVEAAAILADPLGLSPGVEEDLHENDRSATGFLPPLEFEQVANAFFASPAGGKRPRVGAGYRRAVSRRDGGRPRAGEFARGRRRHRRPWRRRHSAAVQAARRAHRQEA